VYKVSINQITQSRTRYYWSWNPGYIKIYFLLLSAADEISKYMGFSQAALNIITFEVLAAVSVQIAIFRTAT
jgi:hypothetical protein